MKREEEWATSLEDLLGWLLPKARGREEGGPTGMAVGMRLNLPTPRLGIVNRPRC